MRPRYRSQLGAGRASISARSPTVRRILVRFRVDNEADVLPLPARGDRVHYTPVGDFTGQRRAADGLARMETKEQEVVWEMAQLARGG